MKLADKIIKLRKQLGWSQEELSEKLNVSRQSVSKWEGALSIPDLNRIIKLGEIFGVSTDYLLKDDIEDAGIALEDQEDRLSVVTLEEANAYVTTAYEKSKKTVIVVILFLTSIVPLLLALALRRSGDIEISEAQALSSGFVGMFAMIAIGVVLAINLNQKYKLNKVVDSVYFELEYGAQSILKEKMEAYSGTYSRNTSIGIALILTSSLPLIISAILSASVMVILFMVILLFVLMALALSILIPSSSINEAYMKLLHEDQFSYDKIVENRRINGLSAFYWPLVVAIYVGWSLWTMDWGFTWIVWPIAALLFAALVGLLNFMKSDQ